MPEMVNLRGILSARLGLKDVRKQGGGLGNLNELGVVLGLSGDPDYEKSISDLTFTEQRSSIPETTVCGTVTTSVRVT